jgi:ABC-2 type transport system permease protein
MRKIWVIARHEFLTTIARKGYIFAVIGMPLFFLALTGLPTLLLRADRNVLTRERPIALVDRAAVIDLGLAEKLPSAEAPSRTVGLDAAEKRPPHFVGYSSLEQALADLRSGRVSACYLITEDYRKTGKVLAYTPEGGFFESLRTPGRRYLEDLLRASLIHPSVSGEMLDRLLAPMKLEHLKVSAQGGITPVDDEDDLGQFLGPFGMFLLLTMAIFFSSGYLLQGVAEEKQNRVIEVLLSSVTPEQLLAGKILGLGAAGLLQVTVYVAVLFLPAMLVLAATSISVSKVLLSVVFFLLGYLLFASLMAATGVIGNTVQESSQLSAIWTLASMAPVFVLPLVTQAPDSPVARGLSYFPLTAPTTMLLRIGAGMTRTSDLFLAATILLASIALAVKGSARVFRAASLMYGKRPSTGEIWRWLREA